QGRHVSHRREADVCGDQGAQPHGDEARGEAASILSALRQARGDDGGTLCSRQAIQAASSRVALLTYAAGRLVRDIPRKIAGNEELEAAFATVLGRADQ